VKAGLAVLAKAPPGWAKAGRKSTNAATTLGGIIT